MKKQEVIERLCVLSAEVGENLFRCQESHDCFCGENIAVTTENYSFSEKVLSFIEKSVREKIEKEESKRKEALLILKYTPLVDVPSP